VWPARYQQAIRPLHLLPVIFIRGSTNETDLIVLVIAAGRGQVNRWGQHSKAIRCKNVMSILRFGTDQSLVARSS
jgi:hypothetical protein